MAEKKEQLELVLVEYSETVGDKAVLTFHDEDEGVIHEVTFQRKGYNEDTKKWHDDPEKKEKVDKQIDEVFGTTFEQLNSKVGQKYDVFIYSNFCHVLEFSIPNKFQADEVGQIYTSTIVSVEDNERMNKIEVIYDVDGTEYMSNMSYSKRVPLGGEMKYLKDPAKKERQLANFKKKFHVDFKDRAEVIGKTLMVEVKDLNGNIYADMKALPKPKK